jgi:hypothetical protein
MSPLPVWPKRADAESFYGTHTLGPDGLPTQEWQEDHLILMPVPFPLRLAWQPTTTVRRIRCHVKAAISLEHILHAILAHYGGDPEKVRAARMDLFGGCYEFRRARGGSQLSMHAWGAAIDLDPERNELGVPWKPGTGMMPQAVVEIFESAGWTWGGGWKRPDPMHFEAAV